MEGRHSSKRQLPKKRRRDSDLGLDCFNQLPDHLIVHILSRLPLRDAVKTSVLSRRWKKLWRHTIASHFVFWEDGELDSFISFSRLDMSSHFVKWLERILKSYKEQPINEFVVRFYLNLFYSKHVKFWIAFALRRNVKRLHLDLVRALCVFPDLTKISNLPPVYSNLKDVCFCYFFLIDEIDFQYFLSKCPSLERLCLRGINGTGENHLDVAGQNLKYLGVVRCLSLKVVISAPNLTSLNYLGSKPSLEMGSMPHLSEFSIAGLCTEFYVKQFARGFRFATQLTILKLELSLEIIEKSISYPQELTVFPVLKHLEITMEELHEHHCLLWLICLVKAAPLLHKFEVEMRSWLNTGWLRKKKRRPRNRQNMWISETTGHEFLKVMEFCGFANFKNQWQLVRGILQIAESLEELVLDLDVSEDFKRADKYMRDAKTKAEILVAPVTKLTLRNSSIKKSF